MFSYYVMSKLSSGHRRPSRTRRDQALMFPLWLSRGRVQRRCGHARYPLLVVHRWSRLISAAAVPDCGTGQQGAVSTSGPGEAAAESGGWCAASAVTLAAVTGSVAATTIALATTTLVATTGATAAVTLAATTGAAVLAK